VDLFLKLRLKAFLEYIEEGLGKKATAESLKLTLMLYRVKRKEKKK
jgi:hypothetical protein